ncbi:MAG: glycosyltransferase [Ignavibacteriaceae bacterium]|jgi:glycosyltransferase involved in cell wall biosynthesis|nr:glycosyltransferase [Ignavibacteriaceae bacterium]MCW8818650.1 glycosyltransferase [Ignavibacteriaceae bacterium]MCW8823014.1 glycosyltransferase [Ignavibacteriaceae bacterium]
MKSSKHILLLTPGFPKDENDVSCIPPLQEFLNSFKARFPDSRFSVISLHYPYRNKDYYWNGIRIIPINGKNSRIKKPFLWFNTVKQAKNINKNNKIDTIHSLWLGECAMLGNILADKFDCEHICSLMGQDVNSTNRYLKRLINKEIKIVAISENQANLFRDLTKRQVDEIINWGIDDRPINNFERDIDLLGVGSLIPLKNYSLFIRLVEQISKKNPSINCKLVGAGPELSKLKAMVKERKVEKNIELIGLLSRTEIFELMQRSMILVHPSTFEGFGYVFAEALINGMNIVSFNVGCTQNHLKWFIAKDEQDFINIAQDLLKTTLDFVPVNLFPLDETVESYASIYGIK